MEKYRPLMGPYYYDPSKYDTYLEQLGIQYPTVRAKPISDRTPGPGHRRRRVRDGAGESGGR